MKTPFFTLPKGLVPRMLTALCIGFGCTWPLLLAMNLTASAMFCLSCCALVALADAAGDCLPRLRPLLYPLISRMVNKRWPAWIAAGCALAAVCLPGIDVPYESMIYWTPVYLMGACTGARHTARFERLPLCRRRWLYPACAALLAGLAAIRSWGHAAHYLFWIPAPLLMWVLADGLALIPRRPWWAECSFYLYCSHMVVEHYAVRLYEETIGTGKTAFVLSNVLLPCLCALLALLCGTIVRKLAPRLFALFTGMRKKLS